MSTLKFNQQNLPMELINSIMMYMSSPTAQIIKNIFQEINEEMNEIFIGDYEYGGSDYKISDNTSFAEYYFIKQYENKNVCEHIYRYSYMNEEYVNTLNEYNYNHK